MKITPHSIVGLVKRKTISWFGAMLVGAWIVIEYPDFRAWLEQGIKLLGPAGLGALILSVVMSTKNEADAVEREVKALFTLPPVTAGDCTNKEGCQA